MAETKEKSRLSSILELQEFLKDELTDSNEMLLSRAFVPITDGLGLESPKKKEVPFHGKAFRTEIVDKPNEAPTLVEKQIKNFLDSESVEPAKPPVIEFLEEETLEEKPAETLSDIMRVKSASKENISVTLEDTLAEGPPPLPEAPEASPLKRAAAIVIDEIFVLTLFCIALVLTSNSMTGFRAGFSTKILQDFSNPAFIRFAVIEFATLWLAYLAVSIFTMNTTFGLWVWNLKISFGDKGSDNYAMRKIMRVIWSFVFSAPLITIPLLMIRSRGKNLIDVLSGSQVVGSEA